MLKILTEVLRSFNAAVNITSRYFLKKRVCLGFVDWSVSSDGVGDNDGSGSGTRVMILRLTLNSFLDLRTDKPFPWLQ